MLAPAVPRAGDFQAGPGGRVHVEPSRGTGRARGRENRQSAAAGGGSVVEARGGRDRLGVGERPERVEARHAGEARDLAPRGQRRGERRGRGPAAAPLAEVKPVLGQDLGRVEPAEQAGKLGAAQPLGLERAGGQVEPGRAERVTQKAECQQAVGAAGFQQRVLGQRAGGDEADHLAADRRLSGAGARGFHLLDDGDPEAAPDQPQQVAFRGVGRDAAERDFGAAVLAARGQRQAEHAGGGLGVLEEQLVEIAHAEEQQGVRVRGLGGEPLRHGRGGPVRAGPSGGGAGSGAGRRVSHPLSRARDRARP